MYSLVVEAVKMKNKRNGGGAIVKHFVNILRWRFISCRKTSVRTVVIVTRVW